MKTKRKPNEFSARAFRAYLLTLPRAQLVARIVRQIKMLEQSTQLLDRSTELLEAATKREAELGRRLLDRSTQLLEAELGRERQHKAV